MILIDRINSNRVYILLDKKSVFIEQVSHNEFYNFRVNLAFKNGIWFFPIKESNNPAISILKCDKLTKNQYKKLLKRFKESEEVKSNGK